MIYVTSDTHFNHANIIKFETTTRPFSSVEEMNETIIANWNSVVSSNDTVIHCGDFVMGLADQAPALIKRLNGKIILVRGNHDTPAKIEIYKAHGVEVHDILYFPDKDSQMFFIFCHFPPVNAEFMKMLSGDNKEIMWCYGHVHSQVPYEQRYNPEFQAFHVGQDANHLTPVSLAEIRRYGLSQLQG